jgi:hypothetical protein
MSAGSNGLAELEEVFKDEGYTSRIRNNTFRQIVHGAKLVEQSALRARPRDQLERFIKLPAINALDFHEARAPGLTAQHFNFGMQARNA